MGIVDFLAEPLWQRVTWTLAHFLWQGFVVACAFRFALGVFQWRSAPARYAACLLATLVMAACPVVTFAVLASALEAGEGPAWMDGMAAPTPGSDLPRAIGVVPQTTMRESPVADFATEAERFAGTDAQGALAVCGRWIQRGQPYLLVGWLGGVFLLSLRLLIGLVCLERVRWEGRPAPPEVAARAIELGRRLGLWFAPAVLISSRVVDAAAAGLWRPVVLLPACWLTEMPPAALEAVLAHELAHIRRWDLWANLLQRFVETLLFYHPAVWWLSRRTRLEREMCCDELAIRATGRRLVYADTLTAVAVRAAPPAPAVLSSTLGGTSMTLLTRVRNILGLTPPRETTGWWAAGLLAMLVVAAVLQVATSAEGPKASPSKKSGAAASPAALGKPSTDGESRGDSRLNEIQRAFRDLTEAEMGHLLYAADTQSLTAEEKAAKEQEWLDQLARSGGREAIPAINGLAELRSRKAVAGLLKIATERREKDNRDRWMAARALGLIGDESAVPHLVPLVYHYNRDTRIWAQISLVRLTGQNFGTDAEAWRTWWNQRGGEPAIPQERVSWATSPGTLPYADPGKQAEVDRAVVAMGKGHTEKSALAARLRDADSKLNEAQRLYRDWTEKRFQKELSGLATIQTPKATAALLEIATDRREKDNRERWQAVRALGLIGDDSVVPHLIPLLYHYNQNTRFWAQISLVRLTGQNFGRDADAWRRWWNASGREPTVSEEAVQWTTSFPEWADPQKQEDSDRQFLESLKSEGEAQELRTGQQVKARERMRRDQETYSQEELREIESLYQVANRQWRSEEARNSLKSLVEKYKKANRTGCAILYLGQMSGGDEQVAYLKQAITDHSDCFYGDGVQVGALARYFLGQAYLQGGKAEEAKALFDEIRRDYPDSVDHSGRSLVAHLPK